MTYPNPNDPFSRQGQINRLRAEQNRKTDPFDRLDSLFDNMEFKPKRTFFKFGLVAILLNLLFWGALIAMVIFGLSFII